MDGSASVTGGARAPDPCGRIVFCVQNLSVPRDPRVWREARSLAAAGFDVSVVCPIADGLPRRELLERVEILRFPTLRPRSGLLGQLLETVVAMFWTAIHVVRLRLRGPISVLHAANPPDTFFVVGLLLGPFGTKFVFDQHDPVPELLRARSGHRPLQAMVMGALERASFRVARVVITPNESCRRLALARSGMSETDVISIRNGPDEAEPLDLARPTSPAVVAFAGTINEHRGVHLLLDAAADILRRRPGSIRLELLGEGDAVISLQRRAQRLGIASDIEWPGWLDSDEMQARLRTATICVAPDEDTEFMRIATSTKVMDYLSLGLPAVVTDLPENRVTAQDAVVYFQPGDAQDLAKRIEEFLDDPDRRATYATRGSRTRPCDPVGAQPSSLDCSVPHLAQRQRRGRMTSPTRVAVLGCGVWGRNIVRAFADLGTLAAVADPSTEAATAAAQQFAVPALSLDEVLGGEGIDAVAIAAPAALHASLALQALDSGRHVFVEKPLALHLSDAEKVVERASETGRILMVGHLLQYHPSFLALTDLVAQGELGRLLYVYSNRLNLGRFRREENVLWSFAPHDISMILRLAGEEPSRVTAEGAPFLHPELADVTTTHLEFPSGVRAHVFVSWLHPYKDQRLVAVGDSGMAVFDDGQPWESKLVLYRHRIDWRDGIPTPTRADGDRIFVDPGEPLLAECSHFLACCDTGAQPRTDGREGLRVLRVLTAAQDAIEHRPPRASHRFDDVDVHPSAEVDAGAVIGPGTRVWHYTHVLAGSRIGSNCVLGQNVMVGPDVTIGDGCKLQNNVSVYKGVTLGDRVFCGPSAVFTNVLYPRAGIDRKDEFAPTLVGPDVTIGANATIVCGTTIGAFATIAAGAVVTHDVPAYALMAGIPARRVGWVGAAGEPLGPDLVCSRTGQRYRLVAPDELEELVE